MIPLRRQLLRPRSTLHAALLIAGAALVGCGAESETAKTTTVSKPVVNHAVERAQKHAEAGRRLASEGDYQRAIVEFTAALEETSTDTTPLPPADPDTDILYERGLAYLEMGFPDTAAEDFSAVISARPNFGPAYAKRGRSYCEMGDLYRAVRDCTTAIRLEPGNAEAYRFRGVAYMRRAQHDRAVADLEHAIELEPALEPHIQPQLAEAYRRWGRSLAADGRQSEASAKLAKARELDPTYVEAEPAEEAVEPTLAPVERTAAKPVLDEALPYFEMGRELQNEGRHDEALISFTQAITIYPEYFDAYLRRGESLMALGFADTAIKDFSEAARLNDRSGEAYRLQAEAFSRMDQHHRAVMSATDALHLDPTDARAYAIRGEAHAQLKNWDRAIADFEEAGRRDAALKSRLAPRLAEVYQTREAEERQRREHAEADAAFGRDL